MPATNLEKYFDCPVPQETLDRLTNKIKEVGFEPQEQLWLGTMSSDFYKGMYAATRIFQSYLRTELSKDEIDSFMLRFGSEAAYFADKNK